MSLEISRLKVAVARRGWRMADVAEGVGVGRRAFYQAVGEAFKRSPSLRWKVEAFLGYEDAIWSSPETLRLRRLCRERNGLDPFLATRPEIFALAKQLSLDLSGLSRTVPNVRDSVLRFIAVNRHILLPPR